jgi:hypothetical protein
LLIALLQFQIMETKQLSRRRAGPHAGFTPA